MSNQKPYVLLAPAQLFAYATAGVFLFATIQVGSSRRKERIYIFYVVRHREKAIFDICVLAVLNVILNRGEFIS